MNQFLKKLSSFDVAIDLGTYKTAIYIRGEGIVLEEPSLLTFRYGELTTNNVIAMGEDARLIHGKEPMFVTTVKPLHGGVVEYLEAAQIMVKKFAKKAHTKLLLLRHHRRWERRHTYWSLRCRVSRCK